MFTVSIQLLLRDSLQALPILPSFESIKDVATGSRFAYGSSGYLRSLGLTEWSRMKQVGRYDHKVVAQSALRQPMMLPCTIEGAPCNLLCLASAQAEVLSNLDCKAKV